MVSDSDNVGEDTDFDALARKVNGRTTRRVLNALEKEDYIGSVRTKIYDGRDLAHQTVEYHVRKLQSLGLVEQTGEEDDRVYYRITDRGRVVLERLPVGDNR